MVEWGEIRRSKRLILRFLKFGSETLKELLLDSEINSHEMLKCEDQKRVLLRRNMHWTRNLDKYS